MNGSLLIQPIPLENPKIAGRCHRYSPNDPKNWIEFDEDYWNTLTYYGKEELVFHELGHCVYGLEHDERRGNVGIYSEVPLSIMYPVHFGSMNYYKENTNYYYKELLQ